MDDPARQIWQYQKVPADNVICSSLERSDMQNGSKSDIGHDAGLYYLQLGRKLVPHLLLDLGSFRATNQWSWPVITQSTNSVLYNPSEYTME